MTLKPYTPEMLDEFALRLLDVAAVMREMANRSREFSISDFALHDKKARQWHENLERWARKSRGELEMQIIEAKAGRRAMSAAE